MSDLPLPPIEFRALCDALLARAHELVPAWLPGGARRGAEYVCGSLAGGKGDSCSVNLRTGRWGDFATDDRGGDLLGLYAAIHSLSMGEAARRVAREEGLEAVANIVTGGAGSPPPPPAPPPRPAAPAAAREPEGWRAVVPVPAVAPPATFRHWHRSVDDIVHTAEYRVGEQLMGYVVRFRTSEGGKVTMPYTWCVSALDGSARWHWKQWEPPRPLYYPGHAHPNGRTVVLVEGEKKADALHALLQAGAPGVYCVASWPGGCKAWAKADWTWLRDSSVLLWPDADAKRVPLTDKERAQCTGDAALAAARAARPLLPAHRQPGMAAMLVIGAMLANAQGCTVQLLPIPAPGEVADGWDCDDAIHADGWDIERVLAFFGQAQPMPAPAPAEAGAGTLRPPGAARDAPADAADRNDAFAVGGKPIASWLQPYWSAAKGRWLTSRKLVIAALEHDSLLAPVLGLNQLSNNIEARCDWPWSHGKAGPISNTVDLMIGQYLTASYGLPSIARASLMEAVETVAHGRPFHPVRDYLKRLRHDGVTRIDKWLLRALGETAESLPVAVCEYVMLVGRYWLLGMVYRVMQPGIKWDYCPVLEGPGGLGKSTTVEVLAGTAYYSDTHFDVARGKEGQEQVQGLWLYEIAELANFGKAEIGLIKAFITAKVDRYRPSYGRTVEAYPRQCVLVGTTNETTYLRDRTGNRRFWPIPVRKRIDIAWLRTRRDQLMAEAYALYLKGVRYTPSHQDEARLFAPMQESRLVETAVVSEMNNVLTRPPLAHGIGAVVNELTQFVTIAQLTTALGVDAAKSNPTLEGQIRGWLEHEGWPRVKRQVNGVRAWGYLRPAGWPPTGADELDGARPSANHEGNDDAPF